jgi:cytochrome c biogenesis protein CcdA
VTIIGNEVWIGFRVQYEAEIRAALANCIATTCESPIDKELLGTDTPVEGPTNSDQVITLPFFGEIDLGKQSLAVSTLIIGFVDGFNPCSLWLISVLLTLTLTSGSRTKVITVGLTYLIVTTIVYSLFILGVFTLFSYIGYLKWIQIIVALVAIGFGVINMKDYFWYKEGVSLTISEKHKPKLYKNMRDSVVTPRSLIGLISTTAVMAAGVSLIEFSCTAGFPVIWSNIMIANNVSGVYFALLLGIYMLIYLLDEIGVIAVATITMKAARVEEKHGRLLKLISGTIMLALGIVMLINPAIMNKLTSSLGVFVIALAIAALIYIVHQRVLPRMGIYIGSGFKESKKKKRH